jgi:hypothetical protein
VIRTATGRRHRRHTTHGGPFEFGADTSLRERLALGQRMHYNAFDDTLGHLRRLQHRLTKAFADYLTSHNIDLQGFIEESATIIQNVQQNIFNNLNAGAMTFGSHSPATAPPPGQPQQGGNPQPGTR